MAMRALAILLALVPVCVMSKPWQFVPIRDYVEFDPVLNLSCSWQTPACQDCGIRVVAKFKGEAAVVAEDEVEPEDHPRRKKPVCFRMKLEAGEQFHLETKGHVFRVKKADACCLRQASFNQDGTEVPSIVSFTPTSSRKSKRFRFCLCEGVDPLKPETFCARTTEEDYVCPISEYTANHTYGACANTSEVENVPEGCVTVDPPAEPAPAPYWDALDNVSADRACRHTTPYDLSESYYGKHFCTETLEDCKAHCENTVGCKGVEFTPSQGRCEVWFADINATYPLFNVTCLRYHRRAQEAQDISFTPSSGGHRNAQNRVDTTAPNNTKYGRLVTVHILFWVVFC